LRSADTSIDAERVQIDLFRRATVARRASLARSLSTTALQLSRRAIRNANPTAGDTEIAVHYVTVGYGSTLADKLARYLQTPTKAVLVDPSTPDLLRALAPVVDAFEQIGIHYHVGGSLASSAFGAARATADINLVADLGVEQVDALGSRLESAYYVAREGVREAVALQRSFNLIHLATMIKVDVFVPGSSGFDQQELVRAREQMLDLGENARSFFVKSAEDIVLRKLSWYRDGGQVSERQWSDVIGVLKVQDARLDKGYLSTWAARLGITALLEQALAEAADPI
jgi:hypothetical protein